MKVKRGSKGNSTLTLTSTLDVGGWSTRRPRPGLDVCRNSRPHPNSILGPSNRSESQYQLGYRVSDCSFDRFLTVSMADNATHSILHSRPPWERHTPQLSINITNCVYPMTIRHAGSYWLPTRGLLFIFDSRWRSQLTGIGIIRLACAMFIGRSSSSAGVPTAKPSKVCDCLQKLITMSERNVNRYEYIKEGKGIKSCDVYGPTWWQKPRYINLTLLYLHKEKLRRLHSQRKWRDAHHTNRRIATNQKGLHCLFSNSMEHSPPWEAKFFG